MSLGHRYVLTPIISTTILRTQSDDRLVALARDGHERAFEALVERYRKPLLRHVRRILPEARAEDAIQQAFLNAWSALQRDVAVREPRAWLYRVAHNAALNALRVNGYDHDELRESVRSHVAGPAEDHERRWVMRRTLTGLAALPEAQREALLRTAVEGRSQEQVAAELGLSEGAVRGLVYRARTALRAAATALTPAPLVGWAAAFASSDVPMNAAERIAQVAAGGGTASVGAILAKAGAVVAVTGALAAGGVAVRDSTDNGRGGPSQAEADTIKPGHTPRRGGAAPPGATLATRREHGAAGEAGRERHGRGERGDEHGRGRGGAANPTARAAARARASATTGLPRRTAARARRDRRAARARAARARRARAAREAPGRGARAPAARARRAAAARARARRAAAGPVPAARAPLTVAAAVQGPPAPAVATAGPTPAVAAPTAAAEAVAPVRPAPAPAPRPRSRRRPRRPAATPAAPALVAAVAGATTSPAPTAKAAAAAAASPLHRAPGGQAPGS